MRAGPAAVSAFLFALLAMPAPPAAAQCTLDQRQERDPASHREAARAPIGDAERDKAGTHAGPAAEADLHAEFAALEQGEPPAGEPGAPGSRFSPVAEVFSAHAATPFAPTPFTRSHPDPYRPSAARPPGAPPLKSEEVAANLKARGFVDVSAVRQRGRSFLAEATGPRGERVRLVLDADSGEINGMQVIGFRPTPP